MAITPEQARELTPAELDSLAKLEKTIDNLLQTKFVGAALILDPKDLDVAEISNRILNALVDLYKPVGWTVTRESDQQGWWLVFKP